MARTAWRLPAATNRFVGRAADISGVDNALRVARLVTITGPGGVGKTRLALEVARKRANASIPIVMVDLSPVGDDRLVATAFAEAVGVPGARGDAIADVGRFLADVKAIVVVDNCEHVVDAAAGAVMSLLEGCPKLRVLATSRSRLRLPGETVWTLGPLAPKDALRLFVERAEAVRAGALTGASTAITMICERLEGLPLALELAAARVAILPPEAILARLDDRLGVLTSPARGVPRRQRSLRATIEWSVDLLSDEERQTFARLAVFPGSFSLAAAEMVTGAELDVLEGLVTQSLVMVVSRAQDEPRYRMLHALRSYAREQLSTAGGESELRDRHLGFFVARAEAVHAASAMGGSQSDVRALSEDLENLRTALAWSVDHSPQDGLRLIGTSRQVWYRGGQAEGRDWSERLLDRHPQADRAHALGLLAVGQFAVAYQDHSSARPRLLGAADLARDLGDAAIEAAARHYLGVSGMLSRDLDAAQADTARSIELFTDLGQAQGRGRGIGILGMICLYRARLEEADQLLNEGLTILNECDDSWGQGQALLGLGLTAKAAGDAASAVQHLSEAVATLAAAGDATILGVAMSTLAGLTFAENPARALRLAGAAAGFRARIGGGYPPGTTEELDRLRRLGTTTLGSEIAEAEWHAGHQLDPTASLEILKPTTPPRQTPSPMTPRRLEIARLVADGMTNAQIAARLHLSERTVENHVFNALTALDLHNRVQLATWVIQHAP